VILRSITDRPFQKERIAEMRNSEKAQRIVRDMERVTPYVYEGLYGNFLRNYMSSDRSRWTHDLARYLVSNNNDWEDLGDEIATLLWERFEKRISC
jgi:hypothetical protein